MAGPTRTVPPRAVVLVEGGSDAAAIEVLARTWAVDGRLDVVPMGGATNAVRHSRRLREAGAAPVLLGVCDAGEQRFLAGVAPPLAAVFVCDRDLEDELIRALGPPAVLEVLSGLAELGRFETFRGQPEWRDRPLHDQLRRFAGTRSGRKAVLAAALAARLTRETTPEPLARLMRRVHAPPSHLRPPR